MVLRIASARTLQRCSRKCVHHRCSSSAVGSKQSSASAPSQRALPGAHIQAVDRKFLAALERRDSATAVCLFEELARQQVPLASRRLSQLLLLLAEKSQITEASALLSQLTAVKGDTGVVPAFIYTIEACASAGEAGLALQHLRQAEALDVCVNYRACRSVMEAVFTSDAPPGLKLPQLLSVQSYMDARGLHFSSGMSSMVLLIAAQASNFDIALQALERMSAANHYPHLEVCRHVIKALHAAALVKTPVTDTASNELRQQPQQQQQAPEQSHDDTCAVMRRSRRPESSRRPRRRHVLRQQNRSSSSHTAAVATAAATTAASRRLDSRRRRQEAVIQQCLELIKPMLKQACKQSAQQRRSAAYERYYGMDSYPDVADDSWGSEDKDTDVDDFESSASGAYDPDMESLVNPIEGVDGRDDWFDPDAFAREMEIAGITEENTPYSDSDSDDSDDSDDDESVTSDSEEVAAEFAAVWADKPFDASKYEFNPEADMFDNDDDTDSSDATESMDPFDAFLAEHASTDTCSDLGMLQLQNMHGQLPDRDTLISIQSRVMKSWWLPESDLEEDNRTLFRNRTLAQAFGAHVNNAPKLAEWFISQLPEDSIFFEIDDTAPAGTATDNTTDASAVGTEENNSSGSNDECSSNSSSNGSGSGSSSRDEESDDTSDATAIRETRQSKLSSDSFEHRK